MGTELAKFAIQIVGFKVACNPKHFFNALKAGSFFLSEQPKIYLARFPLAIHQEIAEDKLYSPDVIDKAELCKPGAISKN